MKSLTIVVLLVSGYLLQGKPAKVSGYYINRETKDTVRTDFEIDLNKDESVKYSDMQWGITYFDGNNAKQTLKPAKALLVAFVHNGKTCKMYSLTNTFPIASNRAEQNFIFMQMTVEGKVRHLIFHGRIESALGNDD